MSQALKNLQNNFSWMLSYVRELIPPITALIGGISSLQYLTDDHLLHSGSLSLKLRIIKLSHCELIVIADNDNLQEPDDVTEYNVVLDSADLIPIPDKIKEAAQCGLLTKNRNPDFDNQSGKQNELPPHCRHCTFLVL